MVVPIVARDGDRVVGSTVLLIRSWNPNSPHRGEISKVIVHSSARRRGLGRGADGGGGGAGPGRRSLAARSSTRSPAPTRTRSIDRLGWHEVGVVPDFALMPDGTLTADDLLLEGPAVTSTGAGRSSSRPDSFKGSLTSVAGRARAGRRLARRARPGRRGPALPAGGRRRGHARGDRGGRRLGGARGPVHDPLGRADRGALAAVGRRDARGRRDGPGVRPVARCRRRTRPDRRRRRSGPASSCAPRIDAGVAAHHAGHRRERHDRRRPRPARRPRRGRRRRRDLATSATSSSRSPATSSNPLLGPDGAAAVYGPQKGASAGRGRRARCAGTRRGRTSSRRATGGRERDTPGAGAAGGVGFAPARHPGPVPRRSPCDRASSSSWRRPTSTPASRAPTSSSPARAGSTPRPGSARPRSAWRGGRRPPASVHRRRRRGRAGGIAALAAVGAVAVPVVEGPQSVEAAMAAGTAPLVRCGERLARLLRPGPELALRPRAPGRSRRSPCCRRSGPPSRTGAGSRP